MLHVADQRVEDRIQLLIVDEVTRPSAASLDDDCQRQRLRIGVWIERKLLRYAVIGEQKVVSGEFEDYFSRLVCHQYGNHHQSGVHG